MINENEQQTINTVKMFFGECLHKTSKTALLKGRFTLQEILQYWKVYTQELADECKRLRTENALLRAENETARQTDLFRV